MWLAVMMNPMILQVYTLGGLALSLGRRTCLSLSAKGSPSSLGLEEVQSPPRMPWGPRLCSATHKLQQTM